ncbi:MAG TPA: LysO family transporter [Spirochaetota bacterium]|nr:LysO family transporter [Spirochaetota bacterium]
MFYVIISMIIGVFFGFLFREKLRIIKFADKLSNIVIFFLLFTLGLSIGVNKKIVENISTLGLKAFLISIGAVIGSLILTFLVYLVFFRDKNSDK